MIPRIGSSGSDIPVETQMLLLEASKGKDLDDQNETSYVILLPVLDGEFRSSLQGNSSNELEFCVESGNVLVSDFISFCIAASRRINNNYSLDILA